MFISIRNSGYTRAGEQHASGRFLILMQPNNTPNAPIRALVRFTALRQLGHFMMGTARVGKHKLTISGAYGNDGLPSDVPQDVYEKGTILPEYLVEAWNNGGASFHHMDDNGYYYGWTHHDIVVTPSLVHTLNIRITGPNRNDIKEYLHEVFLTALTHEWEE